MKKLSKEQMKRKAELSKAIYTAKSALEDSMEKLNEAISAHNDLADRYNEVVGEAKQWCEEIVSEIDDYMSERSDKWQESDAASTLEEWKGQFENFDPYEAEEVAEVEIDLDCEFDDIDDSSE